MESPPSGRAGSPTGVDVVFDEGGCVVGTGRWQVANAPVIALEDEASPRREPGACRVEVRNVALLDLGGGPPSAAAHRAVHRCVARD